MKEEKVKFGNCVGLLNLQNTQKGVLFISGFLGDKDESHGLFKNFIPLLHEQGFSTLRYDASGIDESNYDFAKTTVKNWQKDAGQAIDFFAEQGIEKIGIVGFSLGAAHAVQNFAQNPKIKCMALWAPAFDSKKDMLQRYIKNGDYQKAERGELYKAGKNISTKLLDSLNFDVINKLQNVDCPILICHSKDDPYIPLKTSETLSKKFKNLEELFILENCGHSFRNRFNKEDGDKLERSLTNATNDRELVYKKTADFFSKHLD